MPDTQKAASETALSFPPRKKGAQRLLLFALLFAAVAAGLIAAFVVIPSVDYNAAVRLLESGDNEGAMQAFSAVYDFRDSAALYSRAATETGDALLANGDRLRAAIYFTKAGRSLEAEQIFDFNTVVMGTSYVTAAVSQDGKGYYLSEREGDNKREGAETVATYSRFLPNTPGVNGMDKFGFIRLHALGNYGVKLSVDTQETLTELSGVRDMIGMLTDESYSGYPVVLLNNGTVRVFSSGRQPLPGVNNWSGIVSIKAGYRKIFGIDSAGKLHIAYENDYPQELQYDISDWKDVQKVLETGKALVGLTREGAIETAYAGTDQRYGNSLTFIKDATDIATNSNILVILRANGSPKAVRVPNWSSKQTSSADRQIDKVAAAVSAWTGVTRVRFAAKGVYGIRFNGTVRYISCDVSYAADKRKFTYDTHADFAAAVSQWTDIVDVISCTTHAIGVKADGTLKAVGDGTYLESRIGSSGATDYIRRTGGEYLNVEDWKLW